MGDGQLVQRRTRLQNPSFGSRESIRGSHIVWCHRFNALADLDEDAVLPAEHGFGMVAEFLVGGAQCPAILELNDRGAADGGRAYEEHG